MIIVMLGLTIKKKIRIHEERCERSLIGVVQYAVLLASSDNVGKKGRRVVVGCEGE